MTDAERSSRPTGQDMLDGPVPSEPIYDDNGVDLSLIRWMLSLNPAQRLEVARGMAGFVENIRRVGSR